MSLMAKVLDEHGFISHSLGLATGKGEEGGRREVLLRICCIEINASLKDDSDNLLGFTVLMVLLKQIFFTRLMTLFESFISTLRSSSVQPHPGNLSTSSSSSNIVHTSQAVAAAAVPSSSGAPASGSSSGRHHRKNVISCDSDNEDNNRGRSPVQNNRVVQHTSSQQNTTGE